MSDRPPYWTAPENDYRGVADLPAKDDASIAVVIPVYNRVDSLRRTLASLEAQLHSHFDVVVVDDGSTEDVAGAVAGSDLTVELIRQERDGFGAHRARNAGVASTSADVILFLDADCVADPALIERHLYWHNRARNIIVAGTRSGIDASDISVEELKAGAVNRDVGDEGLIPNDWRRVFYRRSKQLIIGDAAYRAGLSSNLSVRRDAFLSTGGFATSFAGWGGEDTELVWRLWNDGHFVIPDNRAIVFHQTQEDELGVEGRAEAREKALAQVADLVPNRFYRKTPSPFHSSPKVSWLGRVETKDETDLLWRELSQATYLDAELVLAGPAEAVSHVVAAAAQSPRMTVVTDGLASALRATRGEYVALIDGRARIDRRLLARAMARLDKDPRAAAARCSYRLQGDAQYRRLDDLTRLDADHGRDGFPFFAVVRRRELLKDVDLLDDMTRLFPAALARGRVEHLINDHATLPLQPGSGPRAPGSRDLLAAGPKEIAKAGRRTIDAMRRKSKEDPAARTLQPDGSQRINYIGFTGMGNLGDEAVLAGVETLLPEATIARDLHPASTLMVGGGTLINGKGYYLTRVLRNDSPHMEKVLFGTGVRNPDFWGTTEDMNEWFTFIESTLYAGVRGPDSVENLRKLGFKGEIDVLGDPALALTAPAEVEKVEGRTVVCPVFTDGQLWGGSDADVFAALTKLVGSLRREGREVVMMSAFPADDRWLIEIMQAAGALDATYVPGYADLNATMRHLASADLVVGERLHASILAAACGTPFVALEYRPKIRDFAKSIAMEHQVVRTDEIARLDEVVTETFGRLDELRSLLATEVEAIRTKQRTVAADLLRQLDAKQ